MGGEWFEIELGKISRMLVKYEVLPIPNVISVCKHGTLMSTLNLVFKMRKIEEKTEVGGTSIRTHKPALTT